MKKVYVVLLISSLFACNFDERRLNEDAQRFIDEYSKQYVKLYAASQEAQWKSNIDIKEGDSTNSIQTRKTEEAFAAFTGSEGVIKKAKAFMAHATSLTELQRKQMEAILFSAANNPAIVDSIVKARIKAETAQTEKLFGYQYKIGNQKVNTNDIDDILKNETDLTKRRQAWEASKEVGKGLKDGLVNLRMLRNKTVQALGYKDYYSHSYLQS